jgi:hypothetical protein
MFSIIRRKDPFMLNLIIIIAVPIKILKVVKNELKIKLVKKAKNY